MIKTLTSSNYYVYFILSQQFSYLQYTQQYSGYNSKEICRNVVKEGANKTFQYLMYCKVILKDNKIQNIFLGINFQCS